MEEKNKNNIAPSDFETVVLIELGRINDLLSIIAASCDSDRTRQIVELHEQGKILYPPPALEIQSETNDAE